MSVSKTAASCELDHDLSGCQSTGSHHDPKTKYAVSSMSHSAGNARPIPGAIGRPRHALSHRRRRTPRSPRRGSRGHYRCRRLSGQRRLVGPGAVHPLFSHRYGVANAAQTRNGRQRLILSFIFHRRPSAGAIGDDDDHNFLIQWILFDCLSSSTLYVS